MLIILGGLPGTGKSTIARLLASRLNAVWLRIDSIEQSLFGQKKSQCLIWGLPDIWSRMLSLRIILS
ncbi:hypothetical protein PEC106568_42300 [Pectobacterium carotovorum subsp. carotovorum]|nr:hypothetical protein PEC106568_42300 [Pectobacterium carotovorum subsp. carotovorum]